jgi:tetratricopeptide (TPR) repeat protein
MPQDPQFDVFLSHSSQDKATVRTLAERMRASGLRVWFDEWEILPGDAIFTKIEAGLENAAILIFCMSRHAFGADWALLESQTFRFRDPLNLLRRLIPLRLDASDIKGSLAQFSYIDWQTPSDEAYQRLLVACGHAPASAAAQPTTAWAVAAVPDAAAIDISRIIKYAPPQLIGRSDDTKLLVDAWDAALQVSQAAKSKRPHVIGFVALGGEGKTSLLADWAVQMNNQNWPGCAAVFAWSFYSQGTDQQIAASSELFLNSALIFFGDAAFAATTVSGEEKAKRLAALVGAQRSLLLLDGLEPLQYAPTLVMHGELRDKPMAMLLKTLATQSQGLCVLTTRYAITDLQGLQGRGVQQHTLLRLSKEAGVALLRSLMVRGRDAELAALVEDVQGHALTLHLLGSYLRDAHGGDIAQRDQIRFVDADREEQRGHAFRVMDAYVKWFEDGGAAHTDAHANEDAKQRGRIALALLKLMGLFDRPATIDCLVALWQAPVIPGLTDALENISEARRNICLTRLEEARLLTRQQAASGRLQALDAHPLLREYFAQRLSTEQSVAWQAAHARLYTHLRDTTKDQPKPTLEDLQPLYQAVAHGCLAGMQQQASGEVYYRRIVREGEHYSTQKLGAFGTDLGAVACFFAQVWQRVSPSLRDGEQAWLLNQAAFRLRALGRLREATEPMRASLEMDVQRREWEGAARSASNLSELALTLGDVAGAVQYAEQAVDYADRSADAFQRMVMRTAHADALHQAGQADAAKALFAQAEAMQAEWQPANPLLYSLQGFQYCELLLAAPEAAAWQCSVVAGSGRRAGGLPAAHGAAPPPVQRIATPLATTAIAAHSQSCAALAERVAQSLKIAERNNWLLDIGLDHLSLARASLFAAILAKQPIAPCQQQMQQALDGLRRAGTVDQLPRALLIHAWLLTHSGQHTVSASGTDSAQTDLDEAWEIAERGPMPLFMAEIHLYRAGLFQQIQPYPWDSPEADAKAARQLIEKHGYLRRLPDVLVVEANL